MTGGYRPPPYGEEPRSPRVVSVPVFLLATILTLGLFNIYWNYRQMGSIHLSASLKLLSDT